MKKLYPKITVIFDPYAGKMTITDLFLYTQPPANLLLYTCTTLNGVFDIKYPDATQAYLNTNFAASDTTLSDLMAEISIPKVGTWYPVGLYSIKYSIQTTGGTSGYDDSGNDTFYFTIKAASTANEGGCAEVLLFKDILTETACCLSVKAEELYQKKRYCINCDCRCEELDIYVLAHYIRMLECYDHNENECITDTELLKILNHTLKICDGCGC